MTYGDIKNLFRVWKKLTKKKPKNKSKLGLSHPSHSSQVPFKSKIDEDSEALI